MASRPGAGSRLDVLGDQLGDVVDAGLLVLAAVALGGVRRQQVPLGRAGAQRARGDDLEAGLQQVVPVLDVLRVALADDQRNHRTERDALGGVGVPVLGHLVGLDQAGDVGLDREVDDVGGLAVDDGPRLVAGGAVGRGHGDALALLGGRERRDDLAPAGFGHRVGDQGQRGFGVAALVAPAGDVAGPTAARREQRRGGGECGGVAARFCGCSLMTFPCVDVTSRTGSATTARRRISTWAQEQPLPTPNRGRVWNQRQQQTSATAGIPTAMRAKMWPLLLPDAVCMARRITESARHAQFGAYADVTSQQPHDDHQHHQDDQHQRHPRPGHAGHSDSSSWWRARRSSRIPLPSAPSSRIAIP